MRCPWAIPSAPNAAVVSREGRSPALDSTDGEPDLDQSALAARLGVDRNSTSLLVGRLESKGLVEPESAMPTVEPGSLASLRRCVVATLRRDGSPHTVATWYDWNDNRVLLNMDESRLRLRFMRHDPRVALTVLDEQGWHRHVSLLGRIVSLEQDLELRDIDRLALRYTGERFRTRDGRRFSAWIKVEAWHGWDGSLPWPARSDAPSTS